ncbi:uroporphyrinogen-III C-methyltransferase [Marinospirillum sp.]|uniref:uroporphyrinogen-III C-methyltransferase n=1 Tax=Marinospirillum sp. TaxID=2183934 RepID=UPI0028708CFF|nr:uroporphyrinogen-III C-methyltransferase [Marinospirillum sp.]MDR9466947.1 uroporphyrinogen-III C-methyltransferase [Marinospirillum sp.]
MSDQNKTEDNNQTEDPQEKPDHLPEESAAAASQEEQKTEPSAARSSKGLLLLLLLLSLIALAGTATLAWLGHDKSRQLEAQLGQMNQVINSKPDQEAVEQLKGSLQALDAIQSNQQQQAEKLTTYQENVRQHQQQFQELHDDLLKASEPKPKDWQLAEVEYLLRLANQRLQLEEDVTGALTLFKTAEQRLKAAEVPGTLAIRQELQENIAELEELRPLDRVSLAMELQGLADKALTLQVQPLTPAPSLDLKEATRQESSQPWYWNLWQEIKSLVVIKKRELPIEPLPFAEDELALRHQISSLLQQASWAALRAKENLYQQSLERVVARLQAFDLEAEGNQSFLSQVTELQAEPVEQQLPKVEGSLDQLQTFIAERYGRLLPLLEENKEASTDSQEGTE